VKRGYLALIIGIIVFISGIISSFLIYSVQGIDFTIYWATIGIAVSGLMIIGGSFMYLWFGEK